MSQVLKLLSRILDLIKGLFGASSPIIAQEKRSIPLPPVKASVPTPPIEVKAKREIPNIDFKAQIDQNWTAIQSSLPSRTVMLIGEINTETANALIGHLLFLEQLSSDPIMLVIASQGGQVYDGLAIYDALRQLTVPLITVASVVCAGNGLLLLLAGQKRYAVSDTLMAYTVLRGGAMGQPSDIVIQSQEVHRLQAIHDRIFQSYKQPDWDLKTERHFSLEEAQQYKLIDGVVSSLADIDRS